MDNARRRAHTRKEQDGSMPAVAPRRYITDTKTGRLPDVVWVDPLDDDQQATDDDAAERPRILDDAGNWSSSMRRPKSLWWPALVVPDGDWDDDIAPDRPLDKREVYVRYFEDGNFSIVNCNETYYVTDRDPITQYFVEHNYDELRASTAFRDALRFLCTGEAFESLKWERWRKAEQTMEWTIDDQPDVACSSLCRLAERLGYFGGASQLRLLRTCQIIPDCAIAPCAESIPGSQAFEHESASLPTINKAVHRNGNRRKARRGKATEKKALDEEPSSPASLDEADADSGESTSVQNGDAADPNKKRVRTISRRELTSLSGFFYVAESLPLVAEADGAGGRRRRSSHAQINALAATTDSSSPVKHAHANPPTPRRHSTPSRGQKSTKANAQREQNGFKTRRGTNASAVSSKRRRSSTDSLPAVKTGAGDITYDSDGSALSDLVSETEADSDMDSSKALTTESPDKTALSTVKIKLEPASPLAVPEPAAIVDYPSVTPETASSLDESPQHSADTPALTTSATIDTTITQDDCRSREPPVQDAQAPELGLEDSAADEKTADAAAVAVKDEATVALPLTGESPLASLPVRPRSERSAMFDDAMLALRDCHGLGQHQWSVGFARVHQELAQLQEEYRVYRQVLGLFSHEVCDPHQPQSPQQEEQQGTSEVTPARVSRKRERHRHLNQDFILGTDASEDDDLVMPLLGGNVLEAGSEGTRSVKQRDTKAGGTPTKRKPASGAGRRRAAGQQQKRRRGARPTAASDGANSMSSSGQQTRSSPEDTETEQESDSIDCFDRATPPQEHSLTAALKAVMTDPAAVLDAPPAADTTMNGALGRPQRKRTKVDYAHRVNLGRAERLPYAGVNGKKQAVVRAASNTSSTSTGSGCLSSISSQS
ncbi:hypothetical protein RI367_002330 [Sorochytrium milnesiophthora]